MNLKFIDEFRNPELVQRLISAIHTAVNPTKSYQLMEFCGGHTHAIFRYGIAQLMPSNVRFIHGPGCPVCVLPIARLDQALTLATEHAVTLCSYGDMLRVPASGRRSLLKIKAEGADIRVIYSPQDALQLARAHPDRHIVLLAIGFETTAPATAVALHLARTERLRNFSVLCNHVLTPAALRSILDVPAPNRIDINGILGPSHVSTIIGTQPYDFVVKDYQIPVVVAGFEPTDVLQSVFMLIQQCNRGHCVIENQYTRAVTIAGNYKAQTLMNTAFNVRKTCEWRGLGELPNSGLKLSEQFAEFDAELRFSITPSIAQENSACACSAILRGMKQPHDCALFGHPCTPEYPIGACMVSSEGICAAYWNYCR